MKTTATRIKSSEITTESIYLRRRELLKGLAFAPALLAGCSESTEAPATASAIDAMPGEKLIFTRNAAFSTKEILTRAKDATHSTTTTNSAPTRPTPRAIRHASSLAIAGNAGVTGEFTLEDILRGHALEERIYIMRRVEAWSMVIAWIGIPLPRS